MRRSRRGKMISEPRTQRSGVSGLSETAYSAALRARLGNLPKHDTGASRMPLLDHFHPPLTPARNWESFHALWAAALVERLNRVLLPPGYFAETQVHVGNRIEVDVASLEF